MSWSGEGGAAVTQPIGSNEAAQATPPKGGRRTGMLIAGVIVLVGFVGAAIGLWVGAGMRYDDNVAGFARAPVGCETTLDFDRSGEFTFYIETQGSIDSVRGNCGASESYERDDDDVPEVRLTLRDPDGGTVELSGISGVDYDTDDYRGTSDQRAEIVEPGDHLLTVESIDGDDFAIAVGGDPDDGVAPMRWGAIVSLIVGLIGGGVLLVLGSRRASPDPSGDGTGRWEPTTPGGPGLPAGGWPAGPPGFPAPPPTTGASGPAGPPTTPPATPPTTPSATPQRSPWAPPPGQ